MGVVRTARAATCEPRTAVLVTADVRVTADHLALLSSAQVEAVFEGVGELAAILHGAGVAR